MALSLPRSVSYQGSILGPLLFVLFINDLHEGIITDTHIALYADEKKNWRLIKTKSILHNHRGKYIFFTFGDLIINEMSS